MTSATVSNPAPHDANDSAAARAATPVVSHEALRRLPATAAITVMGVGLVTAVIALVVNSDEWWPGVAAAFVTAAAAAAASVLVLNLARGRTVDWLVTLTMAATLARMAVSAAGLLVSIKLLHTPPEVTAFCICGYYAAMLVAETTLLNRATRPTAAGGNQHA